MAGEDMELNFDTMWALINSTGDGLLIVDTNCRVVAVNSTYCKIFHETEENIVGKNYLALNKISLFPTVLKTGKPMVDILYRNLKTFHTYKGKGLYILIFPIISDGTVIGAGASYREITHVMDAAQQYERLANRYGNSLRIYHQAHYTLDDIIDSCPEILSTKRRIERIATSQSPVLLRGESGTGKELFASALHTCGPLSSEPFVVVNCPSLPESLAESELFGYESGAFSGALKGGKIGLLEIADGGTVFLDEIGDLNLELQAKILRVLENGEFFRVGGVRPIKANFRLVSATNRNLEEMIAQGTFREDLYFRLSVITLNIPPLRDRGEDILTLADHFIKTVNKSDKRLSKEVKTFFLNYYWPGNVRQLKNTITTMINFADSDSLTMEDLPRHLASPNPEAQPKPGSIPSDIRKAAAPRETLHPRQLKEKQKIIELLDEYGYSVHAKKLIAEKMQISLATLYNKMNRYGIDK